MSDPISPADRAAAWHRRMGLGTSSLESTAESSDVIAPAERIRLAREQMRRIVRDRLGGDQVLLAQVEALAISGEEAVVLLEDQGSPPAPEQFSALEAVVAFDGTRPSFLVRNDDIDFTSSYSTDAWQMQLDEHLDALRDLAACVGRVELGTRHIGTAFLIAPTLALTNRHVAQEIADVAVDPTELFGPAFLDFGREDGAGRASHDRRAIVRVALVGPDEIPASEPVDHARLDLALLNVAPSTLSGAAGDRFLPLSARKGDMPSNWVVGTLGYPGNWRKSVPSALATQFDTVLERLLDGDAGTKRFAPGRTTGTVNTVPRWSASHDATTVGGNSGSPLVQLRMGSLKVAGLHYGGRWSGERTNWVHILGNCVEAACFPGGTTLRDALKQHGVTP